MEWKIKLKTKVEIEGTCYEAEDGQLGADGIAFNYSTLKDNNFLGIGIHLTGVTPYDTESYAYSITNSNGQSTYVHFDWIKSIEGTNIDGSIDIGNGMVKLNNKYAFNKKTGELKLVADMGLCTCGQLATVTMHDGKKLCPDCVHSLTAPREYNYKPEPLLFTGGQLKKDEANPVWYGLEVEVSTDRDKLGEFTYKYIDNVFIKSDSSIQGNGHNVEIVSHPHSFSALMAKGSWLEGISKLPTQDSDGNGCHVHISRTSFRDDKHYSLFYFLLHRMNDIAVQVGGRQLTGYCKLSPTGKVHQKTKDYKGGEKSIYLNERNTDTVEARFFKGTTNTNSLKAYVQLLESMIKYTKYHTESVSSKGWFEYVTKKSKKYAELIDKLSNVSQESLTHTVTYKKPRQIKKLLQSLSMSDFDKICSITTRGGRVIDIDNIQYVHIREQRMSFRTGGGSDDINFNDIQEIVIEEEE